MNSRNDSLQPSVFVSHGSPMTALENGPYAEALAVFGGSVEPQAILVISAHWQEAGIRIASGVRPKLIYDFDGFPRALYEIKYEAPGSPELAAEVAAELKRAGFSAQLDDSRGWDHGVWVPMRLMFPEARIPIVEISLPMSAPAELHQIGQALVKFRANGVLVAGSGGIVHNLRIMNWRDKDAPIDTWAREFQGWVKQRIERRDLAALFEYERQAPHAALAAPTPEHFAPLFPVLGAAGESAKLDTIFEGIEHANMSMFTFALAD
ncbi:MAG: class III extradiol ring-cleavage dioxygenase [Terriglobales bacterium]